MSQEHARALLPVFRFVGHSGSGKTTLLEQLVGELTRRGLRVAVAKDTHHAVELDEPGKDSWRFGQAGAAQVVLATDRRLVLLQRREARATLEQIAALVADGADVLLAEGFRHASQPAVVVWRAALGKPLPEMSGPVCALVADAPLDLDAPAFPFDDVAALADCLVGPSQS